MDIITTEWTNVICYERMHFHGEYASLMKTGESKCYSPYKHINEFKSTQWTIKAPFYLFLSISFIKGGSIQLMIQINDLN